MLPRGRRGCCRKWKQKAAASSKARCRVGTARRIRRCAKKRKTPCWICSWSLKAEAKPCPARAMRRSPEEKRLRRAMDEVEKGLARNQCDLVLAGLLQLPDAERLAYRESPR